jgi:hypothetical protein
MKKNKMPTKTKNKVLKLTNKGKALKPMMKKKRQVGRPRSRSS